MEKRIDIFNVFLREGKLETLQAFAAIEVENDPFEHTKTDVFMNPIPIKGLIRQISPESLHWKYYGTIPFGSIEVIVEKKYKTIFKTAEKIKYDDNFYKCWKDDSKGFAILERSDYLVVVLSKKEL